MRAGALPVVAQERLYSARPKDDLISLSLETDGLGTDRAIGPFESIGSRSFPGRSSQVEPKYTSVSCWLTTNMGGAQSTPKITARDRAILEYVSHSILLYAFLKRSIRILKSQNPARQA
jgi:hypothetical protein